MGRPSTYTPELEEELIEWISNGQSLREFCRQEHTPSWRSVYRWLEENEDFSSRFARARLLGADAIAQEALSIADTTVEGVTITTDEDGKVKRVVGDMLGHRKLQIETRLKLLAKWFPQKYGDKTEHTINGPVQLKLEGSDVHG